MVLVQRISLGIVVLLVAACSQADPAPSAASQSTAPAVTTTTRSPTAESGSTHATSDAEPWPVRDPLPRIALAGDGFVVRGSGEPFVPVGTNYFRIVPVGTGFEDRFFSPAVFNRAEVSADFARLVAGGHNVVRLFLDTCGSGPDCIGAATGAGLNPEYLAVIAEVTRLAGEHGIYLLLTSNDLPDQGGYWELSNRGASEEFAGYRNAHYLTAEGVSAATTYWEDLLTGLEEAGAAFDAVFAWSILNEQWFFADQPPLSLTSGNVTTARGTTYDLSTEEARRTMAAEGMAHYIEEVAGVIRHRDPAGLVTMGFFHPSYPNPTDVGGNRWVDTAPLLEASALDFFDFHAYPGGDLDLGQIAENFGMVGYDAKPVIMGEFGAFLDRYPDVDLAAWTLQRWTQQSCALGFDGWVHWGFARAPVAVGDATWGLTDAGGTLFDVLSPVRRAPCEPPDVTPANLAIGQLVVASQSLPEEPPAAAVDGGPAQWGAGGDAPQWLEIQFAEAVTIGTVRLRVAQWPAGRTVHVVTAVLAPGEEVELHRFDETTEEGDLLSVTLLEPIVEVVSLRVTTISSPSWVAWREIEVFGP